MNKYLCLLGRILVVLIVSRYEGYWLTADGNHIFKIELMDNKTFVGHLVWNKNGDQTDVKNPDETFRTRSVIGMQFIGDMILDERGRLNYGWIYDKDRGETYHGYATVKANNKLKLRRSIDSFGLFGSTIEASKLNNPSEYGLRPFSKTAQDYQSAKQ